MRRALALVSSILTTGLATGLASGAACGGDAAAPAPRAIRFLHTFGARESELLAADLARWPAPVTTSLVPFARGQTVIGALLRAGTDCPDLIRIDATWLPGLAGAGLLAPAPAEVAARDWLPEARALAQLDGGGAMWAAPQTVDGLVIVLGPATASNMRGAPPKTIDALVRDAQGAQTAGWATWGLGLRVDGYWVVPFLRAAGADVADPLAPDAIESPAAVAAVARFAALFGTIAAPAPAPGHEAEDEARRFRAGEIGFLITGPWALGDLGDAGALRVWPMPGAPRGGQLLVVPRCAADAGGAWQLALHLTEPAVQLAWARALGTVPTTRAAEAAAPRVVREAYAALVGAQPLPREPVTALLFDDLTPAVAAVVAGDATADEAMAGVARAWRRQAAHGSAGGAP